MCGNFVADRIKKPTKEILDSRVQQGIDLHVFIDRFTDGHVINKSGLRLLYPYHGKYAPVLCDIFYDYLLCKNWYAFNDISLEMFCERVYLEFESLALEVNPAIRKQLELLVERRWLERAFNSYEGLERTFFYLRQKVSKPDQIKDAVLTLRKVEDELNDVFLGFYPQLVQQVAIWKKLNPFKAR
jgi:acyl carrier protein phosphodiesterase